MKANSILAISIIMVMLSLCAASTPILANSSDASPSDIVSSMNPTQDKANTLAQNLNKSFSDLDEGWLKPLIYPIERIIELSIWPILLLILIQIFRYVRRSWRYQLIVEDVSDSSDGEELKAKLSGFKQLAREELIKQMDFVQPKVNAGFEEAGIRPYDYNEDVPFPEEIPERSMADLAASLKEVSPENVKRLASLVNILGILIPQRGISISCILQKKGDNPGQVGITVTVRDIGRKQEPRVNTIWEASRENPEVGEAKAASENVTQNASTLFKRYIPLLEPAAFWLALEIYRIKMLDSILSRHEIFKTEFDCLSKKVLNRLRHIMDKPNAGEHNQDICKLKLNRRKAEIYNFIGFMNLYYGRLYYNSEQKDIYKLISNDLNEAKGLSLNWYLPFENLGDMYGAQGREEFETLKISLDKIQGDDNEIKLIKSLTEKAFTQNINWVKNAKIEKEDSGTIKIYDEENLISFKLNDERTEVIVEKNDGRFNKFPAKTENDQLNIYIERAREKTKLLHKAIIEYEIALEKIKKHLNDLGKKQNKDETAENAKLRMAEDRITISKALALHRLGEKEKAANEIAKLYERNSCYILTEVSARSLYNLACYYALAWNDYRYPEIALKWASICLAYSLVRDRYSYYQYRDYGLLWDHAEVDADLNDVRSRFHLESLKFELSKMLVNFSPEKTKKTKLFREKMDEVFKNAGWNLGTETMKEIFSKVKYAYNLQSPSEKEKASCLELIS